MADSILFLPPTSKGEERKYYVSFQGFEYLYTPSHLWAHLSSQQLTREQERHQAATPKSQDAKKLDLFVRKIYLTGHLQLHIANQWALLG